MGNVTLKIGLLVGFVLLSACSRNVKLYESKNGLTEAPSEEVACDPNEDKSCITTVNTGSAKITAVFKKDITSVLKGGETLQLEIVPIEGKEFLKEIRIQYGNDEQSLKDLKTIEKDNLTFNISIPRSEGEVTKGMLRFFLVDLDNRISAIFDKKFEIDSKLPEVSVEANQISGNEKSITLRGTCSAGDTLKFNVTGGNTDAVSDELCADSGTFNKLISSTLESEASETRTIQISAIDSVGNEIASPILVTWTRDSEAPNLVLSPISLLTSLDSQLLNIACENGSKINLEVLEGPSQIFQEQTCVNSSLSVTLTSVNNEDGVLRRYNVIAIDSSGNKAQKQTSWIHDDTAPTLTLSAIDSVPNSKNSIPLSGSCDKNGKDITLEWKKETDASFSVISEIACKSSGNYSFNTPEITDLENGTKRIIQVKQEDKASNSTTSASQSWTRDNVAPIAVLVEGDKSRFSKDTSTEVFNLTLENADAELIVSPAGATITKNGANAVLTTATVANNSKIEYTLSQKDKAGNTSEPVNILFARSDGRPVLKKALMTPVSQLAGVDVFFEIEAHAVPITHFYHRFVGKTNGQFDDCKNLPSDDSDYSDTNWISMQIEPSQTKSDSQIALPPTDGDHRACFWVKNTLGTISNSQFSTSKLELGTPPEIVKFTACADDSAPDECKMDISSANGIKFELEAMDQKDHETDGFSNVLSSTLNIRMRIGDSYSNFLPTDSFSLSRSDVTFQGKNYQKITITGDIPFFKSVNDNLVLIEAQVEDKSESRSRLRISNIINDDTPLATTQSITGSFHTNLYTDARFAKFQSDFNKKNTFTMDPVTGDAYVAYNKNIYKYNARTGDYSPLLYYNTEGLRFDENNLNTQVDLSANHNFGYVFGGVIFSKSERSLNIIGFDYKDLSKVIILKLDIKPDATNIVSYYWGPLRYTTQNSELFSKFDINATFAFASDGDIYFPLRCKVGPSPTTSKYRYAFRLYKIDHGPTPSDKLSGDAELVWGFKNDSECTSYTSDMLPEASGNSADALGSNFPASGNVLEAGDFEIFETESNGIRYRNIHYINDPSSKDYRLVEYQENGTTKRKIVKTNIDSIELAAIKKNQQTYIYYVDRSTRNVKKVRFDESKPFEPAEIDESTLWYLNGPLAEKNCTFDGNTSQTSCIDTRAKPQVGPNGIVYFMDGSTNARIRFFDETGKVRTLLGNSKVYVGDSIDASGSSGRYISVFYKNSSSHAQTQVTKNAFPDGLYFLTNDAAGPTFGRIKDDNTIETLWADPKALPFSDNSIYNKSQLVPTTHWYGALEGLLFDHSGLPVLRIQGSLNVHTLARINSDYSIHEFQKSFSTYFYNAIPNSTPADMTNMIHFATNNNITLGKDSEFGVFLVGQLSEWGINGDGKDSNGNVFMNHKINIRFFNFDTNEVVQVMGNNNIDNYFTPDIRNSHNSNPFAVQQATLSNRCMKPRDCPTVYDKALDRLYFVEQYGDNEGDINYSRIRYIQNPLSGTDPEKAKTQRLVTVCKTDSEHEIGNITLRPGSNGKKIIFSASNTSSSKIFQHEATLEANGYPTTEDTPCDMSDSAVVSKWHGSGGNSIANQYTWKDEDTLFLTTGSRIIRIDFK